MNRIPGVMFVVDPSCEDIAVAEAKKLNIPVVAITDTNCNPEDVDYVIPGNDDAIRAVNLIASFIADAVIEAKQGEDAVRRNVVDEEETTETVETVEEVVETAEVKEDVVEMKVENKFESVDCSQLSFIYK